MYLVSTKQVTWIERELHTELQINYRIVFVFLFTDAFHAKSSKYLIAVGEMSVDLLLQLKIFTLGCE